MDCNFCSINYVSIRFLKFAHDSDLKYISVSRLSVAILTGTLTIYMIPGLWGAPLKLLMHFLLQCIIVNLNTESVELIV